MAVKTFSTGEILTASDTNTYLANAGLDYITQTTFTNVTNVIVDNCFTSTYANYRILFDLSAVASDTDIRFQWRTGGSSGTTYTTLDYDWQFFQTYAAVIQTIPAMGQDGFQTGFVYGNTGYLAQTLDIFNPQAALRPNIICSAMSTASTTHVLLRTSVGSNRVTTAFTGFRFSTFTSVNMTGRVRVYGCRNA